jgi:hypothetical protein
MMKTFLPLLVVAACGEIASPQVEPDPEPTPTPTPTPDPDPAPSPPIKVTVLSMAGDGKPDDKAIVVFVDNQGNVVKDIKVDAAGHAEAELPSGGGVHAIRLDASGGSRAALIQTVTDVAPGDELVIGLEAQSDLPLSGGASQMVGTFTPFAANFFHVFFTECGGVTAAGASFTLVLRDSCHGAKVPLLAIASPPASSSAAPQFVATSIDHVAGGSFTVPPTWQAMSPFALSWTKVPPNLSSITGNRLTIMGPGLSRPIAPQQANVFSPPAGTVNVTVPFAAGVGARALVETFLASADAVSPQLVLARTAAVTATQAVDLSAQTLPWITAAPRPTATGVSWQQRVEGSPDLRLVTWSGTITRDGVATAVRWSVADGSVASSMTLPGLPSAYASIDPTKQPATAVAPISGQVQYVDHSEVAGYPQAHRFPIALAAAGRGSGLFLDRPYQVRTVNATGR